MYKFECKNICWICPYNKKCVIQAQREIEVNNIFNGTNNQQKVKSE